jgi:hypothetical protein
MNDQRDKPATGREMSYAQPNQDSSLEPIGGAPAAASALHDTDSQVAPVPLSGTGGPDLIDAPDAMPALQLPVNETGPTRIREQGSQKNRNFSDDEPTVASAKATQARDLATGRHAHNGPAPGPTQPQPTASPEESAVEGELSQVYHDFIETKQRLGESIDGVSLEKFLVKLKANRAQLMSRYACRTVKFQVYVKDGKAALKATPVQS